MKASLIFGLFLFNYITPVCAQQQFSLKDTNILLYRLPIQNTKPPNWIKKEKERSENEKSEVVLSQQIPFKWVPAGYNLQKALSLIDNTKSLDTLYFAEAYCIHYYKESVPYLIQRLGVEIKVGLDNTADLIIWDRIASGDLNFYGHGGSIGNGEDLFTIAGRASWILNELTGEKFAVVHMDLNEAMAENYKKGWVQYFQSLKK
jgi:hypothetical protein